MEGSDKKSSRSKKQRSRLGSNRSASTPSAPSTPHLGASHSNLSLSLSSTALTPKRREKDRERLRLLGLGELGVTTWRVVDHWTASEVCKFSTVCRRWNDVLSGDYPWRELYNTRFPDERHRKKNFKEAYRTRMKRLADPLSLDLSVNVAAETVNKSHRHHRKSRREKESHSRSTSDMISSLSAIFVSESYFQWSRELFAWTNDRLLSYADLDVDSISSFSSGEVLLALFHSLSPKSVDYAQFDRRDPIRTIATVFSLAEDAFGVPSLLDPQAIVSCGDPGGLLLYLALLRNVSKTSIVLPKSEPAPLGDLVETISSLGNELQVRANRLYSALRTAPSGEDRLFIEKRAVIMDAMVAESLATINLQEERNELLEKKNLALSERVASLEKALRLEESRREKAEEKMAVEEKIKAYGEVLTSRGALEYLGLYERKPNDSEEGGP